MSETKTIEQFFIEKYRDLEAANQKIVNEMVHRTGPIETVSFGVVPGSERIKEMVSDCGLGFEDAEDEASSIAEKVVKENDDAIQIIKRRFPATLPFGGIVYAVDELVGEDAVYGRPVSIGEPFIEGRLYTVELENELRKAGIELLADRIAGIARGER